MFQFTSVVPEAEINANQLIASMTFVLLS